MTRKTSSNPKPQATRRNLILRMQRMLERQLANMETTMTGAEEKEVALLGNMVRTLEKLMELEAKQTPDKSDSKRAREMTALRAKLADHIDALKNAAK